MTEDEAKTKWCPFSRVAVDVVDPSRISPAPGHNRVQKMDGDVITRWGVPDGSLCVAGRCMAWRTHRPGRGYCGLAGVIPSLAT